MPRGMKQGMMGPMMDPRSKFFMALANDQRLKILDLLKNTEKNSKEIINTVGLDASVISRHLMMLRNVGVVNARKDGVTMYFRIADQRIFQIIDLASEITKDWLENFRQFF